MKPVLFVTNHVPADRAGAFAALHARVPLELALFGGRSWHATPGLDDPGLPHRRVDQRAILRMAASGRYRAVVCGTAGRLALPAAWLGARAARLPFVLWTALWAHPRTPAHIAGAALMAAIYRDAHAVVAYGPHVAAFARAQGAGNVHVAPQAVDNAFWGASVGGDRPAPFTATFIARPDPEKGVAVLRAAWRATGLRTPDAALVLAGPGADLSHAASGEGVIAVGSQSPEQIRRFLAGSDVLVMPSLRSRSFREPWGLVANEAMNQSTPVVASDEVGAAAGGLVRHERNGLVVPAGDPGALADALRRLHDDPALRARLGAAARRDVAAYTYAAWASGFARPLTSLP